MNESDVWTRFKRAWPYHCERWEPGIGSGQPDVLVQGPMGQAGLIELKAPSKLRLSPSQKLWHRRWQAGGGHSVVLTCDALCMWQWWTDANIFNLIPFDRATQDTEVMIAHVVQDLWGKDAYNKGW